MSTKKKNASAKSKRSDDISRMAGFIFKRVRQILREHPGVSRRIDELEVEVRERFRQISDAMKLLEEHDRQLVAALIINSITETAEEVLGS
ncbi:MAG: hypothetical protein RDV41_12755 [Planctomycetota bacterium]|nr:hypothetical protein [Planctomycetota bacterium]